MKNPAKTRHREQPGLPRAISGAGLPRRARGWNLLAAVARRDRSCWWSWSGRACSGGVRRHRRRTRWPRRIDLRRQKRPLAMPPISLSFQPVPACTGNFLDQPTAPGDRLISPSYRNLEQDNLFTRRTTERPGLPGGGIDAVEGLSMSVRPDGGQRHRRGPGIVSYSMNSFVFATGNTGTPRAAGVRTH